MSLEPFFSSLKDVELYIAAAAFALARMVGFMAIMPLFTRIRVTGLLRNGVGLALALPVFPMLLAALRDGELTTGMMAVLLMKEAVVGVALGIAMGIPFWAAEAAGDIIDLQRGSTMAMLLDPMMTHETSPTGTLLAIIMVALYLAAGGLELSLDMVYASYNLWPVEKVTPVFSKDAAAIFLDLLGRVVSMAVTLVFPLIVCMLISDLVLAFLARASPHLNVFALSLIVKTFVYCIVLVIYATFLVAYMGNDLVFFRGVTRQIEAIACRGCL